MPRSDHTSSLATAMPDMDFEDVLAAARRGESSALDELFRRYYSRVEQFVHVALARDFRPKRPWISARFSTGDVVQEVFRSVLSDLQGFRGSDGEAFFGYLSTVVRNRLMDLLRFHEAAKRDGWRTERHATSDVSHAAGPETDAVAAERRALFAEVLRTFPDRERRLLRGRIIDKAEFKELASHLGYSSLTSTRRAFYEAHAQLVLRLRRRDLEDPR
ncbi:MAG: RNA polymerase sigma factor [Planctomycetota bacterium]